MTTAPRSRPAPGSSPGQAPTTSHVPPAIAYQLAEALLEACIEGVEEDCFREDLLRRGFSGDVIERHKDDALSIAGRRCTLFEMSAPLAPLAA